MLMELSLWKLSMVPALPLSRPMFIVVCSHGLLGLLILDTQINNAPADMGRLWYQEISVHLALLPGCFILLAHPEREFENE